jgi:hypothetical protein
MWRSATGHVLATEFKNSDAVAFIRRLLNYLPLRRIVVTTIHDSQGSSIQLVPTSPSKRKRLLGSVSLSAAG